MSEPITSFPQPVLGFLQRVLIQNRDPAFLVTDFSGVLMDLGGNLSVYGLQNLRTGRALGSQLDFALGLLPLESQEISLPCIRITPQTFADIHLFREGEHNFILFVDVTSAEIQQGLLQQKANDLHLLRKDRSQFENILCILDIVLLERINETDFRIIGKAPEWIEQCGLRFLQDQNAYQLASSLEFLSNFVNSDEESSLENQTRRKSGPWVETDTEGRAHV